MAADVTERKAFKNQLRHVQKLESLGVLAGGVAHDFNNLLTSVLGNTTLVVESLSADDPHRICLDRVVLAAQRASRSHASDAGLRRGKGRFVVEPVELPVVIEAMSTLLHSFCTQKRPAPGRG